MDTAAVAVIDASEYENEPYHFKVFDQTTGNWKLIYGGSEAECYRRMARYYSTTDRTARCRVFCNADFGVPV